MAPGEYFVSVAVNNNQISNGQKINWHKNDDKTIPCINDLLVDKFGLNLKSVVTIDNQCADFSSRPEMLNFDQANQQLNITIPCSAGTQKTDPTLHMERRCRRCPDGLQLVCQQLPPTGWQQQH
ncbi:FimD/PapC N-terminal domain-containing protein [Escherichia coli]